MVHDPLDVAGRGGNKINLDLSVSELVTEREVLRLAMEYGVDPKEALNETRAPAGVVIGHEIGHILGLRDPGNITLVENELRRSFGMKNMRDTYQLNPIDHSKVDSSDREVFEKFKTKWKL